ncbi:Prophage tail length tape measure protein [Pseudomonas flavescens]|uniref:Prophage tail length tape measure protein n=1 Tax=Phytopseudomonas flavescens TaxID=29435 RepID=A0A1G8NC95_9GAMM|nr:phage tail length tape measure family protein [Pseudomonas flavescens]SDI77716.1 Prophage tail length tape measure protein [Pseudomonas flavescens]
MASNSLGALKLDLVVRIGGFTAPLDQAERHAQKSAKSISDAAKSASQAWSGLSGVLTKPFVGVSIGDIFSKFVAETRAAEAEQAQLAAVLRSTGEAAGFTRAELNDMAAVMEGRSIFSTGDINTAQTALLAFTDVAGDQFSTAMQSAMDMAARTGMTVAQAAETIGQALRAPSQGLGELSKQGLQVTDEQQALARQFKTTGKMADAQGIILDALSESYGGAAQAARDTFSGALTALQNTVDGLLTGQDGSLEAARLSIEALNAALTDPATKAGVVALTDAMAGVASKVIESIPFIIDAGDGAVRVFDVLGNTLVGMYATAAAKIQSLAADSATALSYLPDFAGGAEFAQRAAQYRADAKLNLEVAAQAAAAIRENLERPLKGSAIADLVKQAEQAKHVLREAAVPDRPKASAAAASALPAVADKPLRALPRKSDAAAQVATAHGVQTQTDLPTSTRPLSQEDVLTDQMRERLAVMEAIKGLSDGEHDEHDERAARIVDHATAQTPHYQGADALLGDAWGTLQEIDEAQSELQAWYDEQLQMLETFRAERADLSAIWDAEELSLKQQHEDELARIEQARQLASLDSAESLFGSLSDIARNFGGEQSGIYKAMFAAQKAMSIAQSMIAIKTGIALAAANTFPANLVAMAMVASATANIVSDISSISLVGMAHSGIDSVPADGTWLLQQGERVTTANTSAKLDATLDDVRRNQSPGMGGRVEQTFNVNGNPDQRTIELMKQATAEGAALAYRQVSNDLAAGRGTVSRSLQSGYAVGRRKS